MDANKIIIFDTTLRDGEQTPGVNLNTPEKLEIALALEKLGVDVIEAGFAAASKGDFQAIETVSKEVKDSIICSLTRAHEGDITASAQALQKAKRGRIHIFIATSDVHMQYKLKMSPETVLERAVNSVKAARKLVEDVEFSAEDASRTRPEFLYKILEAVIDAGATTVNVPDTVGYCGVSEYGRLIDGVRNNVPNIDKAIISVHCHNDLGLAVANSLQALRYGARQVECTINGMGERAGNASFEEIVMGLDTRKDFYNLETNVKIRHIYRVSKLVSSLTGVDVQPFKAIVGKNAFLHESGIHQHGVMAERSTYEIMKPEDIGITKSGVVLGKLSGRHAFDAHVKDMGYTLSEEELKNAFAKFKDMADRKKQVSSRDIEAILSRHIVEVPEVYTMESFQVNAGNKLNATATISLVREGKTHLEAAVGDGPIDAAYNAIDRISGVPLALDSYSIKAITEGKDALGEVTVRVSANGSKAMGKAVSTDIIESSILAYISALNRIISEMAQGE